MNINNIVLYWNCWSKTKTFIIVLEAPRDQDLVSRTTSLAISYMLCIICIVCLHISVVGFSAWIIPAESPASVLRATRSAASQDWNRTVRNRLTFFAFILWFILIFFLTALPLLWHCWLGDRNGNRPVKKSVTWSPKCSFRRENFAGSEIWWNLQLSVEKLAS